MRNECNKMRSHPLVIEDALEEKALAKFLQSTSGKTRSVDHNKMISGFIILLFAACQDYVADLCAAVSPSFAMFDRIWTGGQFKNESAMSSPFVWKPFHPNFMTLEATHNPDYWKSDPNNVMKYQKWLSGQPDNYAKPEGCLALGKSIELYDAPCSKLLCVICEIDIQ